MPSAKRLLNFSFVKDSIISGARRFSSSCARRLALVKPKVCEFPFLFAQFSNKFPARLGVGVIGVMGLLEVPIKVRGKYPTMVTRMTDKVALKRMLAQKYSENKTIATN